MMLGTFLAIAILYKGGRAVADRARGGAWPESSTG